MKRLIHSAEDILCMSNLRGSRIKNPGTLPFSFYFSGKNSTHGIRVKPIFDANKMKISKAGTLKLCDDWEYIPGEDDKNVSNSEITAMKKFFRKYLVLFAAVWDSQLYDTDVQDYFEGNLTLHELVKELPFYLEYDSDLDSVKSIEDLEEFCRQTGLVNLHGN